MWLMLQQPAPEDFVIATGVQHSVREFVTAAAAELGVGLAWEGADADEVGRVASVAPGRDPALTPGRVIVRIDRRYFRPAEVDTLLGDATQGADDARLDAGSELSGAGRARWCARTCAPPSATRSSQRHGHAVHKRNDG